MSDLINRSVGFLCSLLLLIPISGYSENHHQADKEFKVTQLTDRISMLQGRGGNIGVLSGEQGILMIDDDYKVMSSALQKALSPFGGEEKLTYIVNTHWHGDHTQGNLHFGHSTPIIAHDNVRARLLTAQEIKLFNMKSEPYPEYALPSITYEKSLTLHINAEEVEILHLANGHTDGDSVVFFKKANVVHLGDHFFNGFFPFIDVDHGGDVLQMAKNIDHVLMRIDEKTVIIPGHGPLGDKQDLLAFKQMLEGTAAEVKKMRVAGMSVEQMQAQGLTAQWDEWADGFLSPQVWIGIINSSLDK
ncbi:MBL fold metallo-hydrolase [uncultured Neptuniibacter sp.]|uniref:MBL fold metallo-hydrolase n=1 Tax=uncultured Neptuniibacter sp. TaxID=502143 RepID=UPI0026350839|nr:MBL fold metallo-hydrolase [uncultured Neptuniibacter sp.]